jgi:site-specific DNA-cytosine methylase
VRTAGLFAARGGSFYGDLILGHDPVLALELAPDRCAVLEQRQRDGWFPNLSVVCADALTWDASEWQGRVDLVHASVPCPKWSNARRGAGSPPDLSDPTVRLIGQIRPEWVMLECVAGFAKEHPRIRRSLRALGYTLSRPLLLDAAAVGAPHPRERYWALGHADDQGESVLPFDDEVAELPTPSPLCWEFDPRGLRVADGLADRSRELEALGDGVVPLCKAAAYLILRGALT